MVIAGLLILSLIGQLTAQSSPEEGLFMKRVDAMTCITGVSDQMTTTNVIQCMKWCLSQGLACQSLTYAPDHSCQISDNKTTNNCNSTGTVTYLSNPKLPEKLEIRLADGTEEGEGRVEVRRSWSEPWGTICDDSFDTAEVNIICYALGYAGGGRAVTAAATFGEGTGNTWMDNLNCTGDEADLTQCPYNGWGIENCDHSEDVGVVCSEFSLQLADGSDAASGRVEVRISPDDDWGTVCDDLWDLNDAHVVCRQLGYPGALLHVMSGGMGQGVGDINLDNLDCTGSELDLAKCPHNGWQVHNCGHGEDAGVWCQVYQVRLVNGNDAASGRVEVRRSDAEDWGTVCDDAFDLNDATVVCKMLGYTSASQFLASAGFGQGVGDIYLDNLECVGTENGLSRCTHGGWGVHNCGHGEDAGVVCQ